MDQYLFREDVPGGRLKFNLPIDRYFSPLITPSSVDGSGVLNVSTAQQLIDKHIMPATVTLNLSAFDVDEDGVGCPEVDHVYVNGRHVLLNGQSVKLSGANNTWSAPSFQIPLHYLKLPVRPGTNGNAPTPAQNEIAIDINTLLCVPPGAIGVSSWAVEIDWASIHIPNVVHPILFVHGWTGDTHAFDNFVQFAQTDGIPSAGQPDLQRGILLIENTASLLTSAISRALTEFGVDKVNLFAHSKGGVVARAAIANFNVASKVDRLITFSSPHHGSRWVEESAVGKCLLEFPLDAARRTQCNTAAKELEQDSMVTFNYKNCEKVSDGWFWQWHWEGCTPNPVAVKNSAIQYATFVGTAAIEIEQESATFPWNANARPYPTETTVNGVYAGYDHGATKDRIESYRCAVSYVDSAIHSSADCPASMTSSEEVSASGGTASSSESQSITTMTGQLSAGAAASHAATVDLVQRLIVTVYTQQPLASLTLAAPGGVLTPISPGVTYAEEQLESTWVHRFEVDAPASGDWGIQLTAGQSTIYFIDVRVESTIVFEIAPARDNYTTNEVVTIYAALVQNDTIPMPGATITVTLTKADDTEIALTVNDNGVSGDATAGDGIFSGQFNTGGVAGYQKITGRASYAGAIRSSHAWVGVAPQSAELSSVTAERALDTNGNGLYDVLEIDVRLNVLLAGHYEINGDLVDTIGSVVDVVTVSTLRDNVGMLQPGSRVLTLRFDGRTIRSHGVNGPYLLTAVLLKDHTSGAFEIDAATGFYQTRAYSFDQFEADSLQFGSGSEEVLDQDGDGIPDGLKVLLSFTILVPDTYEINGRLVGANGVEVGWEQTRFFAPLPGNYTVALIFQGKDILQSGVPGPYELRDVSIFGQNAAQSQVYALLYTTQAYSLGYFEAAEFKLSLPIIRNEQYVAPGRCTSGNLTPIDVVFAIDRSESFALQDRFAYAKTAIIDFMDKIDSPGEQVALVAYDDAVELRQRLTIDKQAVARIVQTLNNGAGSAIGDAIKMSADELLSERHVPSHRAVLILLTDGENLDGSDPIKQADAAKARGIRIFTVTSGEFVIHDMMRSLATSPDDYYYTVNPAEMSASMRTIVDRVRCGE